MHSPWTPSKPPVGAPNKVIPPCHPDGVPVFESNGVAVFGGRHYSNVDGADVVLRLAASYEQPWSLPQDWECRQHAPLYVYMPTVDGEAPLVDRAFWLALWRDLKREATKRAAATLAVLVTCVGGHGRTGTVLCCLAMAAGAVDTPDPIAWLREHYCRRAVETQEQIDYICDTWGVTTEAKPHYAAVPASNYDYNGRFALGREEDYGGYGWGAGWDELDNPNYKERKTTSRGGTP